MSEFISNFGCCTGDRHGHLHPQPTPPPPPFHIRKKTGKEKARIRYRKMDIHIAIYCTVFYDAFLLLLLVLYYGGVVLCILHEINESYVMSSVHQGGRGLLLYGESYYVSCVVISVEKNHLTLPQNSKME
jgi:hypothetical protein